MTKKASSQSYRGGVVCKSLLMSAPALFLIFGFFIGPAIIAVMYSMTDMMLTGTGAAQTNFVGLDNFTNLFGSRNMGEVLSNTAVFLVVSGILGQQVLGLILALMLKHKARGVKMFVGFTLAAGWITPEVVAIVMCSCLFATNGTVNALLGFLGIAPVKWMFKHSLAVITLSNIWKGCAYSMMMFQAALDNVPDELSEAARIDGANYMQTLFHVVIPIISGVLCTDFMLITLGTLGTVGLIYGLTGGGPGTSSTTLSVLMYKKSFLSYQVGVGMAISLVILLIGITLSVVYTKIVERKN